MNEPHDPARLGYSGTESASAIAYTQGVLQAFRARLAEGRPITDDDLADLVNCLDIALRNRNAELQADHA